MYKKNCNQCGCDFNGKGPASLYCEGCQPIIKLKQKERARQATDRWKIKHGLLKSPGVGSGNAQPVGVDSPYFRHGYHVGERLRPQIKARRYCERCNSDLATVSRWHWVVHHRDHNHCNNVIDNLELLCKRCHQIEHECHLSFKKSATTIPQGSRAKQLEAHGTLQGDDIVCPT